MRAVGLGSAGVVGTVKRRATSSVSLHSGLMARTKPSELSSGDVELSSGDMTTTLHDSRVKTALDRMFTESAQQMPALRSLPAERRAQLDFASAQERADAMSAIYMPVTPVAGRLLYSLVRATRPATIVSLGCPSAFPRSIWRQRSATTAAAAWSRPNSARHGQREQMVHFGLVENHRDDSASD